MSATSTTPASVAPGRSTTPAFGAPNVTVRSARTAAPATAPVAPSTPEGTSTATTEGPPSRDRIASACSPSGAPRNPVPKIASTATSALASSRDAAAPVHGRTRTRVAESRPRFAAAGSWRSASGSSRSTVTPIPHDARYLAATNPSPPLLPRPQTTTARRP